LLKSGFAVRGVTRDGNSDKSKALKEKGVEMVTADMVKETVEGLTVKALTGAWGAFLLTSFWEPDSMMKDEPLGRKLVDAAHAAKVQHIVWSSLDNVQKMSHGKYHVPHFTDKAKVTEYIEQLQKQSPPAFKSFAVAAPAYYFQNMQLFGTAKKEGDTWTFFLPETRFWTGCDITEMGAAVAASFTEPERFNGRRIEYWGEHSHPQAYVDTFKSVTGQKAKLVMISHEDYAKLPFPGAKEIAEMFAWFNEYSYYGPNGQPMADWSGQRNTPGGLSNFAQWLAKPGAWKF